MLPRDPEARLRLVEDELVREADSAWRFARRAYRYVSLDDSAPGGTVFRITADAERDALRGGDAEVGRMEASPGAAADAAGRSA